MCSPPAAATVPRPVANVESLCKDRNINASVMSWVDFLDEDQNKWLTFRGYTPPPPPSWQFLYMGKIFVLATSRGVDSLTWTNFSFHWKSWFNILSIETLNTNFSQILICVNFVGERKTSWGVGMKGSEEAKRGHCPSISKDRFEAASKMMMVMT